jgi:hypothetical protein
MKITSDERSTGMGATMYTAVADQGRWCRVSDYAGAHYLGRSAGIEQYEVKVPKSTIWANFYRSNSGREVVTLYQGDEEQGTVFSFAEADRWLSEQNKGQIVVCNAFSLNMLKTLHADISIRPLTVEQVKEWSILVSAIGHADTAAVFSTVLGRDLPANRATLSLETGDRIIVGQYRGPRLPEGTTELPEGATIEWCLVAL